jgi:hypothetical protein
MTAMVGASVMVTARSLGLFGSLIQRKDSAQAEERKNRHDHDDQADEIDKPVHASLLFASPTSVRMQNLKRSGPANVPAVPVIGATLAGRAHVRRKTRASQCLSRD